MIDSIHVLHVDDDPEMGELVETFLEEEDDLLAVHSVTSVDAGLTHLAEQRVDCIVSDYDMPDTNGIEFLTQVREDFPDMPFILYTGKGSEEIASEAISAGVTDYLQKEGGSSQFTVLANRIRNSVEKYHAQRELVDREKRLNQFIEQSPLGVIRWDLDFTIARVNDRGQEILGYSEAELVGETWEVIIPEENREEIGELINSQLLGDAQGYLHNVNENVRKDGEIITCEWHSWAVRDERDEPVAVYSNFQDITERKERERRYDAIFNHTYQFTGLMEPDGTLIEANQTALEFGDLDKEHVVGQKMWDLYWFRHSEATRDQAREAVTRAATGEFVREELPVQGADGDEAIIDFSIRPITDEQGEVVLLVPEGREITELIERERALARQHDRLATLFENFPEPTIRVRYDQGEPMIQSVNDAFVDTFGYTEAEAVNTSVNDLIVPPDEAKTARNLDDRVMDGDLLDVEIQRLTKDGPREFELRTIHIEDEDGAEIFAVYNDITETKRREEQLRQERDRLDDFAQIVSHDLRNPLNVVESRIELASDECDSPHLQEALAGVSRMERLIEQLLTLSRQGEPIGELEAVALRDIVTACWGIVKTHDATLDAQLEATVRADRSRLKQLVENLLRNAVEHGGKSVTITAGELPNGFYLEDDGPGIPESEREKVFEQGYSSARDGNGFGLTIVNEIVEAHGWQIAVTESADGGARFEITNVEFVE